MLFGYGASAINPYLVNEIIEYHHNLGSFNNQSLIDSIEKFSNNFLCVRIKIDLNLDG